ncbi:MAG: hypothetical protein IKU85_09600 [Bacteroidaceae bacterium]|nr:hypothetical protein [Bacteroidaceae bacterium]
MAKKGTRQNPYWGSEYLNTDEWRGGWVLFEASNLKSYITQHRTEYRERDGEILGSKYRPFTYAVYDEMKSLEIWTGGWVLPNPNDPNSIDTTYRTTSDEIFGIINLIPFGNEENPIPTDVYNEMVFNGIWFGGWVLYPNGNKEYIENMYGGSSGCGSGCGCGSGASLRAGIERYRPMGLPANSELVISWGDGSFSAQSQPSLTVALVNYLTGATMGTQVNAYWGAPYQIVITCTSFPNVTYQVPGHYWN